MPSGVEAREDEQLVAVRAGVLNDVEHAVGNLLQRMHHAARAVRGGGAELQGERLQAALDDLEQLLDLFFDYVSPVAVDVQPLDAARVAESLAAQLRANGAAEVTVGEVPSVRVLADLRALGRSFHLLARGGARQWAAAGAVAIDAACNSAGTCVEFSVRGATDGMAHTAQGTLAAAVAGRLLELQGGELAPASATRACAVLLATAG